MSKRHRQLKRRRYIGKLLWSPSFGYWRLEKYASIMDKFVRPGPSGIIWKVLAPPKPMTKAKTAFRNALLSEVKSFRLAQSILRTTP